MRRSAHGRLRQSSAWTPSRTSRDLDLLLSLLRAASLERLPGINVLVHGPPGSGKSQLVRSVAGALQLSLHQVPDAHRDGEVLKGPRGNST